MFKKIHSKFTNKMIEIYVKFSYPTSNTYTLILVGGEIIFIGLSIFLML